MGEATRVLYLTAALFLAVVSAPAIARDAYSTYTDKEHPLADTAILISEDDRNPAFIGSNIAAVDGKTVGSFWSANIYAVRVLPGPHKFLILAMWDKRGSMLSGPMSYKSEGYELDLDMKPLHVYVTRWRLVDGKVEVAVEDLGERPEYRTVLAPKPRF
jgi:hypothetical protein